MKGARHDAQKHADDRDCFGIAGRSNRDRHVRPGQVLTQDVERSRVLRLQGIRRLAGRLERSDRRGPQGDRRQSDDDRRLQGRRSRQRQTLPRRRQDREAPVEAEEEYRGSLCRGCAGHLLTGLSNGKGQQEISEQRRMGIRALQL